MLFQVLRSKTVTVERIDTTTGAYVSVGTVEIIIRPLESGVTAIDEGLMKTYKGYVDFDADVQENDRIVDGTDKYTVVGVSKFDANNVKHKELILHKVLGEG